MSATIQDYQRCETDRFNEIKGHLEIALLEKHFLRKYPRVVLYAFAVLYNYVGLDILWSNQNRII